MWTIIISIVSSLGGGTWLGQYLTRKKISAETESINLKNAETIRMNWEKLYNEMEQKIEKVQARLDLVEKELMTERMKNAEMRFKLAKYERDEHKN